MTNIDLKNIRTREGSEYGLKGDIAIIASTIFIHPSIPLMRKEQIVLPNEYWPSVKEISYSKIADSIIEWRKDNGAGAWKNSITKEDFEYHIKKEVSLQVKELRNKHAEMHSYTEEDLRKALRYGITIPENRRSSEEIDNYINSLKQPKEYYIVEFEMDIDQQIAINYHKDIWHNNPNYGKPKLYKEGEHNYVNITSIKPL